MCDPLYSHTNTHEEEYSEPPYKIGERSKKKKGETTDTGKYILQTTLSEPAHLASTYLTCGSWFVLGRYLRSCRSLADQTSRVSSHLNQLFFFFHPIGSLRTTLRRLTLSTCSLPVNNHEGITRIYHTFLDCCRD